jgi:Dolichyl-phosphate-mannose-protein mannosyltransferase
MSLKRWNLQLNIMVTSKQCDRIVLVFCLMTCLLALFIGYFREVGAFGVESDFYEVYAIQAENILAGRAYTYQHNPPGYCLLLAAVTFLTKNTFAAGKIISAFATGFFGWISYLLLKTLFSYRLAAISTILLLLTLIPSSFLAATDVVSAAAITLPLWLFLRQPPLKIANHFWLGLMAGIAYLIRGNAIFVSVGITFCIVFVNFERTTWQKHLVKVAIFIFGVVLVTFPWFIYSWKVNGSAFASTAYLQVAAHFFHPQDDEYITNVLEMRSHFHSFSEVLLHNPPKLITRYLQDVLFLNISKLFLPNSVIDNLSSPTYQLVLAIPLFFTGIGLFFLLKDTLTKQNYLTQQRVVFLFLNLLGYLLLGLVGFHRRYYLFLFPLVFTLIIYPFVTPITTRFYRLLLNWVFIIHLIFLLGAAAYVETSLTIASEPKYLLAVATFLKNRSVPNEIIIIRKPHLAYLANLKAEFPLAITANEYLNKAKQIDARYIAYSDYEASLWQGLKSLSNPKALPNKFKLIYTHSPTNTLIYEVK